MYRTVTELAAAINQHPSTITNLLNAKIVRPAVIGSGRGRSHRLSVVDSFCVTLAIGLKGNGWQLDPIRRIVGFLQRFSEAELVAQFESGCTHIMVSGGRVMAEFLPPAAIAISGDHARTAGAKGLTVIGLDIAGIYRSVVAQLQQAQERDQRERSRILEAAASN